MIFTFLLFSCSLNSKDDDSADTAIVFQSALQTGGTSGTTDSTALTLTFDADPTTLTSDNITVTGAAKGVLTESGTTRSIGHSGGAGLARPAVHRQWR
jgi:hypothetical protein